MTQKWSTSTPSEPATKKDDDVSERAITNLKLTVARVNWFSTYRVHHRVAARFREGRAFLLGDAAHVHSPVGGQGMNTGIGDAVNLAWKLAAVLNGEAPRACWRPMSWSGSASRADWSPPPIAPSPW
jgi:2-polyprenyl-6-methoxyphenol hydroxylase-like FAD-dependent oxidoreductase